MNNTRIDTSHGWLTVIGDWIGKIWKLFVPSTNIDDYSVSEEPIAEISRRIPATDRGRNMMAEVWPQSYQSGLSSETYLGCVGALLALTPHMRQGMSVQDIQVKIEAIDGALKKSQIYVSGSHRASGAALTIANAWERTCSGLTPDQLFIDFDSELIYASQMYMAARDQEKSGQRLS